MLFNSIEFLLFLPIVFLLYWFVFNKTLRWQNLFLLISSYFFYGWWSWKFMLLLALSTFIDYIYGFYVASPNKKKAKLFLWLSIINNLGILATFKYYNFFVTQFQNGFELLGLHTNLFLLHIALPVGISFYTFHGLSYVIDIYNERLKPERNFINYSVFVCFFPLLVAGPIERASHLIPQIVKKRSFDYSKAVDGLRQMLWGLFKKIVIADNCAVYVNDVFDHSDLMGGSSLLIGSILFSIQVYCDFSGYTDIALGTARLFGFELMRNFNFPYLSKSVTEFWRRWHISLSSWLRDYLYISMGGNRKGKFRTNLNLFLTMLIGGFWHGASWNFIIWGAMHGIGLAINKLWSSLFGKIKIVPKFITNFVFGIITFHFVCFCWIFFKASNLDTAMQFIHQIVYQFTFDGANEYFENYKYVIIMIAIGYLIHLIPDSFSDSVIEKQKSFPLVYYVIVMMGFIALYSFFKSAEPVMPIYLQF